MILDCAGKPLDLSQPSVMGILNVTPDSFSDGGRFCDLEMALDHARAMVEAGAAIIDVGGESTRPGATPVSVGEELARIVPVVEVLSLQLDVPISVDTSKAEVIEAAAAAGAGLINDVRALTQRGALEAAASTGLPVCLMHLRGEPRTMQIDPRYGEVIGDLIGFFTERIEACDAAGIDQHRLILDPGFGFGKKLEHNLDLLANLDRLTEALNLPLLVGVSRKSMFGDLLGAPVDQRLAGSLAAALLAAEQGVAIVRAHDVRETVDALRVWNTVAERRR